MNKLKQLKKELQDNKDSKQAEILSRFFKTGKGEYGEGSIFLGIKVPVLRKIAKNYLDLDIKDLQNLLNNKIHTYRFVALVILVEQYKKENDKLKKKIYNFYIKNIKNINNWDLVDTSAPHIIGHYLYHQPRIVAKKKLQQLALSKSLWERRVAIVSTFYFIRQNRLGETYGISKILLKDKHDLIHKAVGWMLRESGKKNQKVLEDFLEKNIKKIPRTTLRYSIEKFTEKKRKYYLNK